MLKALNVQLASTRNVDAEGKAFLAGCVDNTSSDNINSRTSLWAKCKIKAQTANPGYKCFGIHDAQCFTYIPV